jgi:hypothetical protein
MLGDSFGLQAVESLQVKGVIIPCVTHHKQADGRILDMVLPPADFYLGYPLQLDHSYTHKTCKTLLLRDSTPEN